MNARSTIRPLNPKRIPWPPLIRFFYLCGGAVWLLVVRSTDSALVTAALTPILPVLLHLSLVLPERRPIAMRHPYIFRWIYGAPAIAFLVPPLLLAVIPTMGGHLGYHAGFELRQVFKDAPASAQAVMALSCFWLAYLPVAEFGKAYRSEGWKAIASRPITVIFTLLCVPVAGGLSVAFASLALHLPRVVPDAVRNAAEMLLLTLAASARFVVMVGFPAAALVSLLRGFRTSLRQAS